MNPSLTDLAAACWNDLMAASADRGSPLRTPVLSTVGTDGAPAGRTVILRAVEAEDRRLIVFTDGRSLKISDLEDEPRAALTFYDPAQGIQMRAEGAATLFRQDAVARRLWDATPPMQRRAYRAAPAPGDLLAAPQSTWPAAMRGDQVDAAMVEPGFVNFTVISLEVTTLHWLKLTDDGNRAARFDWRTGKMEAAWAAP
jgi:hypothetical protein